MTRGILIVAAVFGAFIFVVELLSAEGRSAKEFPGVALQVLSTLLLVIGLEVRALGGLTIKVDPKTNEVRGFAGSFIGGFIAGMTLLSFNNCLHAAVRGHGISEVPRATVAGTLVALMVIVVGLAVSPQVQPRRTKK